MDRLAVLSLAVLVFGGAIVNCLEFEDEQHFDNAFRNWRRDLFGPADFAPTGLYPRRRSDEGSNEEVDVISGPLGGGAHDIEIETHSHPGHDSPDSSEEDSVIIQESPIKPFYNTPFFSDPFFNAFGFGFPGFGGPQNAPWWKGPNVCTERKEQLEDWESPNSENNSNESKDLVAPQTSTHFGFHVSLNTCVEKSNKHICKSIVNERGRKKTISTVHQCCHGYGRKRNMLNAPCEKIDLYSLVETSMKLEGKEFIRSAQKSELEDLLKRNVTVFLPTDASFTEFAENALESNLVVLPLGRAKRATKDISGVTTRDLIETHIVEDVINIEDVENEQIFVSKFANTTIRMNIFPKPPSGAHSDDDEYPYRYTANCVPITKPNQQADNGIVHVLGGVMYPVTETIIDIVKKRSDMAVLQTVLEKTNLAKLLADNEKQFTLFAPTDSAFEKLEPHLRKSIKEGKGCALNLLKNHILDMTFCSVAVADEAKTSAINSLGEKVNFERVDADTSGRSREASASEVDDLTGAKVILVNGEARVSESDLMAINGVVHVVDTLLPTESAMPVSTLLEKRNLTMFKQLIELSGFGEELDSYVNVSIFAPTDEALESNYWAKKIETEPDSLKGNSELTSFLKYHIAKPLTKTCDLTENQLDTETGDKIRVNLYSTHTIFSNVLNRATVNCARLVHFDLDSCGSVLHQVDRVLEPPTQNLLELIESNEEYSKFAELIKEVNMTDLLANANRSLTILIPKNDIFAEVKDYFDELRKEENHKSLEDVIKAHIIDDVLCCAGIVKSDWPFVRLVKTINDFSLRLGRDRRPKIQNAGITRCDIIAKNGIVHEINDLINIKWQRTNSHGGAEPSQWTQDIHKHLHQLPGFGSFF